MRLRKRLMNFARSLRARAVALVGGSLALVFVAAIALAWGVAQSDYYLNRVSRSEQQQELLISLSGRIGDYALAIMDAVQSPQVGRTRLANATSAANAVFDQLEKSIEGQVEMIRDRDERNAEATESLGVARMRAMFRDLDRRTFELLEAKLPEEQGAQQARGDLDVFGITFTPLLAQAVDRERQEAAAGRATMRELRGRLTATSAAIGLCAILFALALYILSIRPIIRRLKETSQGMEALTGGALGTRLSLRGHDEFTSFMARFNRMAESFARRQAKLTEAQSHLQETIAARTAELRAANERLNAIDQNRRRFFTDISHELRTPLTVIRGEAEMTLRHAGAGMPGATRQSLETIANRAIRLNRRVDDMLRVARSETGRIELSLDDVDLSQIFAAAIDDVLPLAGQKNIRITPPEGGPVLCSGDKDWLRQILGGVLANAIQYSERDTAIVAACWRRGGEVTAEISDEGSGLDEAELASVFERFERGSSSLSTGQAGHGVGLALAKWVIAEHGGSIRLESPGRLHKNGGTNRRGLTVLVSLMAPKALDHGQETRIGVHANSDR